MASPVSHWPWVNDSISNEITISGKLPNFVTEAISCGIPVVGFPIGGVPEMVRSGSTGWLEDRVTAESLATAINCALTELSSGVNLRKSAREIAETEYSAALQGRRYVEFFQAIQGAD